MERFTFTVGKLDAGMAILIGDRAHLIEFPSLLLPPGVTSGSIVNISVNRNLAAEKAQLKDFWSLQDSILQEYGLDSPAPPDLKLRHVTQTSVTLEWPALTLAKADVRSLEIFKNGERLATIPNPKVNTSTKLSSLQSNEEYTFQLILKTTAGTYPSNIIRVRTHTMNDTSGISVCFGNVEDPTALDHAKQALEQMRAKWTDKIQIDTTHFVCSNAGPVGSAYGEGSMAPSSEFQKATQMSLPIVLPQWVLACHAERKLVPVSNYHLGSAPQHTGPTQTFARRPSSGTNRRNSMTEAAEQLQNRRAPSPETIARMSMTPSSPTLEAPSAGYSKASNTNNNVTSTISQVASGAVQAATNAVQKLAGDVPAAIAAVTSTSSSSARTEDPQQTTETTPPPQSKSPKPETNGKLDRRFKFPNSPSPPTSASLPTMPDSTEQEVNTGAESSTAAPLPEVAPVARGGSDSQPTPPRDIEEESVKPESPGPINVTEEPKSIVTEPVDLPAVANTPVAALSTTTETKHEQELDDKAKRWMERQSTVDVNDDSQMNEDQGEGKKSSGIIDDLLAEDSKDLSSGEHEVGSKAEDPVAAIDLVEASEVEPPTPGPDDDPTVSSDALGQAREVGPAEPVKVTDLTENQTSGNVTEPKDETTTEPNVEPSTTTEKPDEIVAPVEPAVEAENIVGKPEGDNENEDDEGAEEGEASGTTTPANGTITPGGGAGGGGGGKSTGKKKKGKGKKGK